MSTPNARKSTARRRMAATGEKYTQALRAAGYDDSYWAASPEDIEGVACAIRQGTYASEVRGDSTRAAAMLSAVADYALTLPDYRLSDQFTSGVYPWIHAVMHGRPLPREERNR